MNTPRGSLRRPPFYVRSEGGRASLGHAIRGSPALYPCGLQRRFFASWGGCMGKWPSAPQTRMVPWNAFLRAAVRLCKAPGFQSAPLTRMVEPFQHPETTSTPVRVSATDRVVKCGGWRALLNRKLPAQLSARPRDHSRCHTRLRGGRRGSERSGASSAPARLSTRRARHDHRKRRCVRGPLDYRRYHLDLSRSSASTRQTVWASEGAVAIGWSRPKAQ
jgi:hypothetical protein